MTDVISEGAACACMDVQYNPKHYENGTSRDRWTCKLCGMEYVKMVAFEDVAEEEMQDLDELLDDYREDAR